MEAVMMKGLVSYAPFDSRYEDVTKPTAEEGEIILRVKGCGICAGDLKSYHGGLQQWGTDNGKKKPYIEAPVVGGHEFFGEVVEIGKGVAGYELGDRVCAEQIVPCGECEFCKKGEYWMCTRSAVFGFKQYAQGGFAEYVKLPKTCIKHKIPFTFNDEQAVLIEPIACGMHAVEQADIKHNDVVVISGLGAIGTSMINIASLYLPRILIGIDLKDKRVEMGKQYGADYVFNPTKCDVVKEIKKLTNGLGCDVYIDATGSPKSVEQGLNSLKNHGRYVQMGVFPEKVSVDWNIIGDGKELTIIGSHLSGLVYESVIKGIANGMIKTDGLISNKFSLKDWKQAMKATEEPDAMKVMLVP